MPGPDIPRAAIEQRAHKIWIAKGRREGHAMEDWVQAETELKAEAARAAKAPMPPSTGPTSGGNLRPSSSAPTRGGTPPSAAPGKPPAAPAKGGAAPAAGGASFPASTAGSPKSGGKAPKGKRK